MTDVELANTTWWASFWGSVENWAFLGVVVALAIEFAALKFGAPYKEKLDADKDLKIAELNQESARLREASFANAEANLANARAGRDAAISAQSILATAETLALAQGFITKEKAGEATKVLLITSKLTPFAGKQFAAISSDIMLEALRGSLRQALIAAGWIEVGRSDATSPTHRDEQSNIGGAALVKIHVDATKASELGEAAAALASALRDEGIDARAEPIPKPNNPNAIQIQIGTKTRWRRE